MTWRALALVACAVVAGPTSALAQTTLQAWGNLTLNWATSDRLAYELDLEPKALVSAPADDPGWWNLDVSPSVSYSPNGLVELLGELGTGYTKQTDNVKSVEVTPRVGVTWHFFSRDIPVLVHTKELPPHRRVVIRDTMRVEARNFFYSGGDEDSSHTARFRNRLEFLVPLNKPKLSDDGTRYVLADWEWFFPLGDPSERFANKQRIRAGLGYRRSRAWRFEALYIWNRSRNTIDDGFKTHDNIVDVRIKRFF
jgi:hypothetical protein